MPIKRPNNQFAAFVKKEFLHVFRDPKTLLMLFGLPVVMIVLFGFAVTNEIKDADIIICDYSNDQVTQKLIGQFQASNQFNVKEVLTSYDEIEDHFKGGDVKLAVIFPDNFANDLFHNHHAQVQLISDGSDPNTATTLVNYANIIIMGYQQELMQLQNMPMKIDTEIRMLYNPELRSVVNFVPGVMSLILLLICVLMTSVSIVKEKENGTMEVLLVSPFESFLVIVSKAVPYLALSLINLTVILLLSVFVLNLPISGSILLLYLISTLFIVVALSLGLLISNLTSSQQVAMMISLMGMMVPSILLTGFMFPLENMPYALQLISHISPAKWYYIIIKSVMIKGLGFGAVWQETLILVGMAVGINLINVKKFKTRLE